MIPQATKLIEECSEVIHALCKVERFGENNFHPTTGVSNQEQVDLEIRDLYKALAEYTKVTG